MEPASQQTLKTQTSVKNLTAKQRKFEEKVEHPANKQILQNILNIT